ncbi:MAG: hypothetical protein KKB50_02815 [Planctomycetes bacterium]|nr:hypothetical protein [Planctomycetota bacterium]
MAGTQVCPRCSFENHSSSRFCIGCGKGLSGTGAASGGGELEPHENPELPQPATEDLLKRVVVQSKYEYKPTKAGFRVTVPLAEQRQQKVYVMFNGHDDEGHDIISFLSICGPRTDKHADALLRLNSRLPYAAFAIKTIEGQEFFVVTANQLAATADPEEVRKLLYHVARRADALENQLSDGHDVY